MISKLPVIALLGNSGVGKDLAGSVITEAVPYSYALAFADKLKAVCIDVLGMSHGDLYTEAGKAALTEWDRLCCPTCSSFETEGVTLDSGKISPDVLACNSCGAVGERQLFNGKWSNRAIAQYIGTEGFRRINPYVWVDYALRTARTLLRDGKSLVIITDCRFISEMERVQEVGGEVWKITRPSKTGDVGIKGHASEMELLSIPDSSFQSVIANDGSVERFKGKVLQELKRFEAARQ